jgi:UDP-glucose 4-epimerase
LAELKNIERIDVDCQDADAVSAAVQATTPDVIFHLVSSRFGTTETIAQEHLAVNTMGTLNVLEAARQADVRRVVITGSAAEYGSGDHFQETQPTQPATVYGATKLCASILGETYARGLDLPVINLRLFTPFGPWEGPRRLIPSIILSALRKETVKIGSPIPERDFVFLEDVVDALMIAATHDAVGTVNIASGRGTSVGTVAKTILELMQSRMTVESSGALRPNDILKMSGDIGSAQRILGWRPRHDFRAGLEKTIAWVSSRTALAHQLD